MMIKENEELGFYESNFANILPYYSVLGLIQEGFIL